LHKKRLTIQSAIKLILASMFCLIKQVKKVALHVRAKKNQFTGNELV